MLRRPPTPRPAVEPGALLTAARSAMGTRFEVRVPASCPGATELACAALDRIESLENILTVYRDDSEVSRLNATAHEVPVPVSADVFELLRQAGEIGKQTRGAYDVTAGALSLAWGFTRGPKRVPSPDEVALAMARTGMSHLTVDSEARTVRFDVPGVVVNFGSIGKGYAIDEAANVVRDHWWPTPALVHGGNSSVYALGSPDGLLGGYWRVCLRNPFDPSRPLGEIALRDRGLGTSGSAFQRFEADGRSYGHIIDPRTGEPPERGPASVSVLAPTAAEADALSTAFYLMGPAASSDYLAGQPEVGAIFVMDADEVRPPRLILLNVSDREFRPDPNVRLAITTS
jgi:FAD:protein FMN transferase